MNYTTAMIQLPLLQVREARAKIRNVEDLRALVVDMANLSQESVQVVTLDSKNGMINRHMVTLGLLDSSEIHPREIFRAAILDSEACFIVFHNHPSGDSTPSANDINITRRLIQASKIIGIPVMDHCIITRQTADNPRGVYSMREAGILDFSTTA